MTGAAHDWGAYNQSQVGRGVRPLLRRVLELAGPGRDRLAVDLGAGAGIETRALLEAGWRVLAVDGDPAMPERLADRTGPRLETRVVAFEQMDLPPADLVHAGLSLPFVHPDSFRDVWARVLRALPPGGWLAVDLFGDRDSWAATRDDITFLPRNSVEAVLAGLDVVQLDEEEVDGPAFGGPKHWHVYRVLARRLG